MRKIIPFFISFFLLSCASKSTQNRQESIISYEATARGFYMKIEILGSIMKLNRDRNREAVVMVLNDVDVKSLDELFQKINLKELKSYKAPTEKRFYDGAAIANFNVTYQGQFFKTKDFDHGNPPLELKELINKIVSLTE